MAEHGYTTHKALPSEVNVEGLQWSSAAKAVRLSIVVVSTIEISNGKAWFCSFHVFSSYLQSYDQPLWKQSLLKSIFGPVFH